MIQYSKPQTTLSFVFSVDSLKHNEIEEMYTRIYLRSFLNGQVQYVNGSVGISRVHRGRIGKTLSWDFILQNMDEKGLVKKLPTNIDKNDWLNKQIWQNLGCYSKYTSQFEWLDSSSGWL